MPPRLSRLAALATLLALASGASLAQPVTVEITADLAPGATLGVRGDTAPLAWDVSTPLTDPDGDGVYTVSLPFPEGTGPVAYKAVMEAPEADTAWEPGGNRLLLPGRMERDRRAFGATQTNLPMPTVSARQLTEDLGLLRATMESIHPGLRLHNTDQDLLRIDDALRRRARTLAETHGETIPMSEVYLLVTEAVASIRDGHTQVSMYNQGTLTEALLYSRADRVPFAFRLAENRMLVTGDATPEAVLPMGTEILRLDGRPVDEILRDMMPYTAADGGNDAKRVHQLQVSGNLPPAERFDVLYSLLYTPEGPLAVDIRRPDGERETLAVQRLSRDARRTALRERNPEMPRSSADLLRLRFQDDGTALLRIGSFSTFNMDVDYDAWLTDAFRQLRARGTDRLVVDLRGNGGGMDDAAALLFRHLLSESVTVNLWQGETAYDRIPDALRPHLGSWSTDFLDISDQVTTSGGDRYVLPARPPIAVSPAPEAFEGAVAVLVDAGPSSATFYLAQQLQAAGIPLVGQTTGGSLKGINGGQIVFLTLPNSGVAVDVPLYGSRPAEPGPDRGVLPDVLVPLRADDLVAGRDADLDAALELLDGTRQADAPPPNPTDALLGTWLVDLRPTPEADPYTQLFDVMASGDDEAAFDGAFYGSRVENAIANDDWDALRVAFTTRDGSGTYHHSATLRDGRLHGTTHSPARGFLSVWTATRPLPLADLRGDWEGTLTYVDYRDDATEVTLTLTAEALSIPGGIRLELQFVEPDGTSGGTGNTVLRDGAVSVDYDGQAWSDVERVVTEEGFRLVIEREGSDNDQPATLRHTLTLRGDVLTNRKEVRYLGGEAFFQRNLIRLSRP